MPRYVGSLTGDQMFGAEPDYIYYNADIINNNNEDKSGSIHPVVLADPQLRFTETRDKALIVNANKYHFSIVRFSMNGANLDLPLFIPSIVSGQVYDNYALTYGLQSVYSFTFTYQQIWNTDVGPVEIVCNTIPEYMYWVPQNRNSIVAPPPAFGQPIGPANQDLSSRWWWANDFTYVLSLINYGCLQYGWADLQRAFVAAWAVAQTTYGFTTPCPYATISPTADYPSADFVNGVGVPPQITWNADNSRMTFYGDSDCFGQRKTNFVDLGTPGTPAYPPYCRTFMNNNMYGLFSGFSTIYYNTTAIPSTYPISTMWQNNPYSALGDIPGATQELLFTNQFYQNVADYRLAPYAGTPPLGFVPTTPYNLQKVYWEIYQDFTCVDTLWSPIASIVFQSTLMPIVKEAITPPTDLGTGNLSQSLAQSNGIGVAQSAFSPIITDVAIDQFSGGGADAYRHFIYYAPSAEYRLSDTSGSQDIRSIDISVFWKARLTGQVYPIQMFNLSSVNIKVMFRKKGVALLKDGQ